MGFRRRQVIATVAMQATVFALIGGFALFGAALSVRDAATLDANDWGAAIRAVAVAVLPAVGLHMALGLPDGLLRSTARRVTALLGYAVSAGLAVHLLDERPDVPIPPVAIVSGAFALVAIVGFFARCRAARSAHERARLQWVAWAVVVAGAIAIVVAVLHELVSWPEAVRGVAAASIDSPRSVCSSPVGARPRPRTMSR